MTWDEICKRVDGAVCGAPALKGKDAARGQVRELAIKIGCPDPDNDEIPEDTIGRYCDAMKIRFDDTGDIISLELPFRIEEMIYWRKKEEYIREDVGNILDSGIMDEETALSVSEEQMQRIIRIYHKTADCNVPYNVTLENAVRQVLEAPGRGIAR